MRKLLLLPVVFLCFAFFQKNPFKELAKLEGRWRMITPRGPIFEEWKKTSDSTLDGRSYTIKGGDTILLENIRLVKQDGQVLYVPTVQNQNDRKPVIFSLVESKNHSFVFENPGHDFPQRIIYRFVTKDSVVARIEGISKGKEKFSEFYYSRFKGGKKKS